MPWIWNPPPRSPCGPRSSAFPFPSSPTRLFTSLSGIPTRGRRAAGSGRGLASLRPLLEDPALKKYGQNIKYDYILLAKSGIHLRGIAGDTMIASYLLNPSKHRHSLEELAREHLDRQVTTYADVAGSGAKADSFQPGGSGQSLPLFLRGCRPDPASGQPPHARRLKRMGLATSFTGWNSRWSKSWPSWR